MLRKLNIKKIVPPASKFFLSAFLIVLFFSCIDSSSYAVNSNTDLSTDSISIKKNRLSFYFQDIQVRSLLQLIAKNSGLNFIISDAVKGNITLNLKNVTWQQALTIILKTQGLTSRRMGDIMYISTIENITNNEVKELQSEETISNLAPLQSTLIHLKYTNATDIASILKGDKSSLLTNRGQVAVDTRTNSLIIRDTKAVIKSVLPEIRRLDVPARQVLIEARIVNIDILY